MNRLSKFFKDAFSRAMEGDQDKEQPHLGARPDWKEMEAFLLGSNQDFNQRQSPRPLTGCRHEKF